jgi:hypothetical protein
MAMGLLAAPNSIEEIPPFIVESHKSSSAPIRANTRKWESSRKRTQ